MVVVVIVVEVCWQVALPAAVCQQVTMLQRRVAEVVVVRLVQGVAGWPGCWTCGVVLPSAVVGVLACLARCCGGAAALLVLLQAAGAGAVLVMHLLARPVLLPALLQVTPASPGPAPPL